MSEDKCSDCEEVFKDFKGIIHDLNGKLSIISGGFEYVSDKEDIREREIKMMKTAVRICMEFSITARKIAEKIDEFLKRIREKQNLEG